MNRGQYTRTELSEAKRKLSTAETFYSRLLEKNRKAEIAYRAKIARLKAEVAGVDTSKAPEPTSVIAETKDGVLVLNRNSEDKRTIEEIAEAMEFWLKRSPWSVIYPLDPEEEAK